MNFGMCLRIRRSNQEVNPIPGAELEDIMFGDIPVEVVNAIYERMEEDQSSQPYFLPFKSLYPMKPYKELYREIRENLSKASILLKFHYRVEFGGK